MGGEIHAVVDSGATRTIVPSEDYLISGTFYPLRRPLYFRGYDKESKTSVATHGGLIAIKSNTGMTGTIVMKAIVLPATQQPLISMSQLDDNGCYMTMGGGKLRVRRRRDRTDFLELPRPSPQEGMMLLHSPPPPENKAAGGYPGRRNELSLLYPDRFDSTSRNP